MNNCFCQKINIYWCLGTANVFSFYFSVRSLCFVPLLFQWMSRSKKRRFLSVVAVLLLMSFVAFFFEVRVVPYQKGSEVRSMSFNAVGTDKLNWFSQAKLLSSPWSDLKTARYLIHFDITGSHKRYFEITSRYGGCPNDKGWLVVGNGACPWERHGSSNSSSIRFSGLGTDTNWNNFGKRFSFIKTRFQWLC